ncbi:chemotaxis protein CheW [Litoribrevibacter euphylliae]|uniref:Chemotaxis protein CheW n=1 Tax=Litoribrevibacter euphylliae TaxID=1834034 RepID=A0ABV7HDV9_9GAMM
MNPFKILQELAAKSRIHAAGLPAQEAAVKTWSGVAFRVAGGRFLSPLGEVVEVLDVPRFTQIPGVKPWVKGIANVRGRLLPIMDFASYLGSSSNKLMRTRKVLVVDYKGILAGLIVDEVMGMQHFPADAFQKSTAAIIDEVRPYVMGEFPRDDRLWTVISLFKLAQDQEFVQVAV